VTPPPSVVHEPVRPPVEPPAPPRITWARVTTAEPMPALEPGAWRVHLIDVGTGLAILIQGHDFAMLYDAGTNDGGEQPTRVLDYLDAALASNRLDHVVLSHPHLDHASALEEVLDTFDVGDVWDTGRINDTVFYRDFLAAVARSAASYHTAAPPGRTLHVKEVDVTIDRPWTSFSELDEIALGDGARFTILHADHDTGRDPNASSIVLAVELGGARLLLTGDAESGPREDPSAPLGDAEAYLVEHYPDQLDADILQVGHHGSKTSSRRAFLDYVTPSLALISAGPRKYGKVTLPDDEVVAALEDVGAELLRTDVHDAGGCDLEPDARLGPPSGPGGCDSYVVTIAR